LIDVRQFWRNRNNTAEMSVPACAMPTQKTKFVMSQPQPTGIIRPQTPTPVEIRYATIAPRISVKLDEIARAMYHALGIPRDSTTRLIVSVRRFRVGSPSRDSGSGRLVVR